MLAQMEEALHRENLMIVIIQRIGFQLRVPLIFPKQGKLMNLLLMMLLRDVLIQVNHLVAIILIVITRFQIHLRLYGIMVMIGIMRNLLMKTKYYFLLKKMMHNI